MCGGRGGGQQLLGRGRAQWWRRRSNCCAAVDEKQLCNKAMEDGGRRVVGHGRVFIFFLNPTFNPTFRIIALIGDNFWDFGGVFFATIQGRTGIGRIGGHSVELLGHPTSNPTSYPTPILPKKLLRLWA